MVEAYGMVEAYDEMVEAYEVYGMVEAHGMVVMVEAYEMDVGCVVSVLPLDEV
jgi:hypothetical protein